MFHAFQYVVANATRKASEGLPLLSQKSKKLYYKAGGPYDYLRTYLYKFKSSLHIMSLSEQIKRLCSTVSKIAIRRRSKETEFKRHQTCREISVEHLNSQAHFCWANQVDILEEMPIKTLGILANSFSKTA